MAKIFEDFYCIECDKVRRAAAILPDLDEHTINGITFWATTLHPHCKVCDSRMANSHHTNLNIEMIRKQYCREIKKRGLCRCPDKEGCEILCDTRKN